MQKIISCRPDGRIRRAKVALSTDQKIANLVKALGMDAKEYKMKADLRAFSRVSSRTLLILTLSASILFTSCSRNGYGCKGNSKIITRVK
jgi:hypothetical protein